MLPRPQGEEAGAQVGRPVHRVHRRDRRGGHAPAGAPGTPRRRRRRGAGPIHDICFYGPNGAMTPTGDLVLETREWRERVFAQRAGPRPAVTMPPIYGKLDEIVRAGVPRRHVRRRGMALNQLLVQMDGIDDPPFWRRFFTNRLNTFLDAQLHRAAADRQREPEAAQAQAAARSRSTSSAPPTCRSRSLDPALIRPGRMGRHIWFRTPTKDDRKDIFELYMGEGRPRRRARQQQAPRRARAHHQRLLAGDDRAGLLDGAHLRALR